MTNPHDNPPTNARAGDRPLDEGQFIDWIDGRLSDAEQARLEAASGRPGVRTRIEQMRANARALRAAGIEKAPPELAGRVLAALERDALVGRRETDAIPISLADDIRGSGRGGRWSVHGPVLALAAGIALLVGGGIYWSSLLLTPRGGSRGLGQDNRVAIAPPEAAKVAVEPGTSDATAGREMALARTAEVPGAGDATMMTMAAAGPADGQEAEALTGERALALASEGRLALRVRAGDVRGLRALEAAGNGRSGRVWRLTKNLPPEAVVALATPREPGVALASGSAADQAAALLAPLLGPGAAMPASGASWQDPLLRVKGAYTMDLPATATALDDVRDMLGERLKGEAVLEELPAPLVVSTPTPEGVLWWTQAPTEWTRRVTLPVIVELR